MLDAANEASSEQVSSTQLLRPKAAGGGGWFRPEAQDGGPPAEIARMEGRSREKKGESFGGETRGTFVEGLDSLRL